MKKRAVSDVADEIVKVVGFSQHQFLRSCLNFPGVFPTVRHEKSLSPVGLALGRTDRKTGSKVRISFRNRLELDYLGR